MLVFILKVKHNTENVKHVSSIIAQTLNITLTISKGDVQTMALEILCIGNIVDTVHINNTHTHTHIERGIIPNVPSRAPCSPRWCVSPGRADVRTTWPWAHVEMARLFEALLLARVEMMTT